MKFEAQHFWTRADMVADENDACFINDAISIRADTIWRISTKYESRRLM